MGKIRVRTLGEESLEKKQKLEARLASEAKRTKKKAEAKSASRRMVKGAKGGERIVAVGPTEEELAKLSVSEKLNDSTAAIKESENKKTATAETQKQKKTQKKSKKQGHSRKYLEMAKLIDKTKTYVLGEALKLLPQTHLTDFDETVELHINTTETGISGTTTLPHGSGKEIRVAIASDEIISNVQKGKIDFDVLLAQPQMMPKLARVAKFLGPRGLMPNPKAGTITNDPQKMTKSFQKGQINFKTEAKAPIMHLRVGKLSFGEKKLEENIKKIIDAVKKEKIRSVTLKSTMSPGIKLKV